MVPQMMTRLLIPTDMLNCSPAWGYTYLESHIFHFQVVLQTLYTGNPGRLRIFKILNV